LVGGVIVVVVVTVAPLASVDVVVSVASVPVRSAVASETAFSVDPASVANGPATRPATCSCPAERVGVEVPVDPVLVELPVGVGVVVVVVIVVLDPLDVCVVGNGEALVAWVVVGVDPLVVCVVVDPLVAGVGAGSVVWAEAPNAAISAAISAVCCNASRFTISLLSDCDLSLFRQASRFAG
jgi:hypothetical protein